MSTMHTATSAVTATSSSSGHVEEYENEEKGVLPTL
jgi:hypothetical protein